MTKRTCRCGHSWNEHTTHRSGAEPCKHFGCGCSDYDPRPRPRLSRQEQLEGLADMGIDTWEEYRGER